MDYADAVFQLDKPGPGGVSMRAHLEQAGLPTQVPPLPDQVEHVWGWFLEVNATRTSNGFGPNPLTFTELASWSQLTATNPTPWEVQMMKALDRAYLAAMRPEGGN